MTTAPHPARAPRRDATENRAALLDAARTCLQRDPDASIETIAAAAGLSRRAVYGHFPSRDDLVREVVTSGAARIAAAMPTTSDLQELPPAARLAAIAVTLWTEVSHVRSMARVAVRSPFAEPVAEVFAPCAPRSARRAPSGSPRAPCATTSTRPPSDAWSRVRASPSSTRRPDPAPRTRRDGAWWCCRRSAWPASTGAPHCCPNPRPRPPAPLSPP
ncbi:TetR/AcrR family transcriptional regulator [Curtobacterium sp. 24E2]|nr:TetR/AcrR family transcriptional regulator [Curtobacterium sp. 24E2]